ncbi:WG repeat-containing protein [Psychrobacter glacincola]|uniref:WG repeat-containing protein n=1 Tax=Psychrobacter glacincola TaxID=56810 RepID=UPI003D021017
MNKKNQVIIPIIYDDVRPFSESKAAVEYEGKWGVINDTGELTIPYQFDEISYFSEGLTPVRKDELWGYIDSSGNTVVPLNYLNAGSFHNGLAVVAKENGYGMINKDNKIIVPTEYDMPIFTGNDYIDTFKFVKGNHFYYFDSQGNLLVVSDYLDTIPKVIHARKILKQ